MTRDFEECLKNRRIVKQGFAPQLVDGEIAAADADLERAKRTFADGDNKWATIQAYYSMFHAARALLHNRGYREKSHFCLKAAVQTLYVGEGALEQRYIDDFDTTMLLRETADYESEFSQEGAELSIERAECFLNRSKELLKDNDSSR